MLCRGLRVCCTNCWQFAPELCVRLNLSVPFYCQHDPNTGASAGVATADVSPASWSQMWPWALSQLCAVRSCAGLGSIPALLYLQCPLPPLLCLFTESAAGNSLNKTHFKPQIPSSINTFSKDNPAPCVKWVCSLKHCWNSRQSS